MTSVPTEPTDLDRQWAAYYAKVGAERARSEAARAAAWKAHKEATAGPRARRAKEVREMRKRHAQEVQEEKAAYKAAREPDEAAHEAALYVLRKDHPPQRRYER